MTYIRETGLTWPLLVDRDRTLYASYGMERGTWWNIFGPSSLWVYAKLLIRGRRIRLPHDDTRQLGGDVLIDPAGIVRLHHVGTGPADRPAVDKILDLADK